jgi:hypothetical protein
MSSTTIRQKLLLLTFAALSGCGGDLALPGPSAVAGEPDTLRAVSPSTQPGRGGEQAADPPTVVVLDRFGGPAAGAQVEWEVTAGGGEVSGGAAAGPDGRASATWTLGSSPGVQKLVARVEGAHGSPVTFVAVVLF